MSGLNIYTIEENEKDTVKDNVVLNFIDGRCAPTKQIKKMFYFTHGKARYTRDEVLSFYLKQLTNIFSKEDGKKLLEQIFKDNKVYLITSNGQSNIYTDFFLNFLTIIKK